MFEGLLPVGVFRNNMAVADQLVLVDYQTLQAHRTPGMNLICADSHFRAKAVAESVAETGGTIPENIAGINQVHEPGGVVLVARNDAVGVAGAVMIDMVDSLVYISHHFD